MSTKQIWPLLALLLLTTSCSETAESREDARRTLLTGLGQEVFLPRYVQFEKRAQALEDAAIAFCAAPVKTAADLQTVQEAWWAARAPWKRNEVLAFGPYTDEPGRYGPSIDFWPARVSSIETVLLDSEPLSQTVVAGFGTTQKGFPVIEYLLYEPEIDLALAFNETPRRCEYLVALCEDLSANASRIRKAWDPKSGNYAGELSEAGRDSETFDSLDMALGEVTNRLVFSVENIRGDKLGGPLGTRSGGTPQPDTVESRFSGRSLEDARDTLRGVEQICLGSEAESSSLAQYLENTLHEEQLVATLKKRFASSQAALDAVPETLGVSVVEDAALVQEAIDVLAELQRTLQVDVINAMGLTLTFNDNDGD